jgi:hypothetical protein
MKNANVSRLVGTISASGLCLRRFVRKKSCNSPVALLVKSAHTRLQRLTFAIGVFALAFPLPSQILE